jgi:hypothetical protein
MYQSKEQKKKRKIGFWCKICKHTFIKPSIEEHETTTRHKFLYKKHYWDKLLFEN